MLILTRRVGETVMIGDNVSLTVLTVRGNQVRLGINAPKTVAVHRKEIYDRIQSGDGRKHGPGSDEIREPGVGNSTESGASSYPADESIDQMPPLTESDAGSTPAPSENQQASDQIPEEEEDNIGNRLQDKPGTRAGNPKHKRSNRRSPRNPWSS